MRKVLVLTALLAAFGACAAHQETATPTTAANDTVMATRRRPREASRAGSLTVTMPRIHRIGNIEKPSVWKFELHEDPAKHVVLLNVLPQEKRAFYEKLRILFSWPSLGSPKPFAYTTDENNAEWAALHFRDFLLELAANSGAASISVVAHSMGNGGAARRRVPVDVR